MNIKEKNKQNKGITLIALVITIIVMLILVSVSISMAVNGGLFNYAGKAVGDTENEINKEGKLGEGTGIQIADTWYDSIDDYMDGIGWVTIYEGNEPTKDNMIVLSETEFLFSDGIRYRVTIDGIGTIESTAILENEDEDNQTYVLFVINGEEITTWNTEEEMQEKLEAIEAIEDKSNISFGCACNLLTSDDFGVVGSLFVFESYQEANYIITKIEGLRANSLVGKWKKGYLKVGDYVDYTPDGKVTQVNPDDPESKGNAVGTLTGRTDEEQTITVEDLKWRVLGYDEEKDELLLISATPTENKIYFDDLIGWNNYEDVLNNTCKALYSNSEIGAEARSITMDDIDKYLGGNNYDKTQFELGGRTPKYGTEVTLESEFMINSENKIISLDEPQLITFKQNSFYYIAEDYIKEPIFIELLKGNMEEDDCYFVASKFTTIFDGSPRIGFGAILIHDFNLNINHVFTILLGGMDTRNAFRVCVSLK